MSYRSKAFLHVSLENLSMHSEFLIDNLQCSYQYSILKKDLIYIYRNQEYQVSLTNPFLYVHYLYLLIHNKGIPVKINSNINLVKDSIHCFLLANPIEHLQTNCRCPIGTCFRRYSTLLSSPKRKTRDQRCHKEAAL